MGSIYSLIRNNIRNLEPYSSARDEYTGDASVFLDANENPYFTPLNRYPDPRQRELKELISRIRGLPAGNIFLGNGSDEAIDILIRSFCEPGTDNIVAIDPTYGMYGVTAAINGVEYRKAPLGDGFGLDTERIRERSDKNTKIIFICSPNNPTGNSFGLQEIGRITEWFGGLLVIDEAYIDFSREKGFLGELDRIPNLVVLQTLSKGWGRAGIRLGMAFATAEIIDIMNRVKPPYNVSTLTIEEAIRTLMNAGIVNGRVEELITGREWLREQLSDCDVVKTVFPSDANFLLVRVVNANAIYDYLARQGIIVRNRNTATGCENCLRISVGTRHENGLLIDALRKYPATAAS